MFQLERLNESTLASLAKHSAFQLTNRRGAELELGVNEAFVTLRGERARAARTAPLWIRVDEVLDRAVRTEAVEYLDRPDFPEEGKLAIVRGVHMMNTVTGSYQRFLTYLRPELDRIAKKYGRPARLLEIASGAGGFAIALASLAQARQLPVTVAGSDIVPIYVKTANAHAQKIGVPASFHFLNAMDMHTLDADAYDIIFIAQSTHHFTPGQLARIMSEASRVATSSFVSIDGWRSLHMLLFVAGTSFLSFNLATMHDAVVTARKFYSEPELRLIARLGAPQAKVRTTRIWPLNTVLQVDFSH